MQVVRMIRVLPIIGIFVSSMSVQALTGEERSYLEHASKRAPLTELKEDAILRFESDVTGDGLPEIFYSKESFRDGGQGHVWSVFTRSNSGGQIPMGDVTFSERSFKPAAWEKDEKVRGFYSFSRGGAGMGSIVFFEVGVGGVTERERTKIAPNGEDKDTYERIFSEGSTAGGPSTIAPERVPVPADYDSGRKEACEARRPRPPGIETDQQAGNGGSRHSRNPETEPSSKLLAPAMAAALFLLVVALGWLIYKRRATSSSSPVNPHAKR